MISKEGVWLFATFCVGVGLVLRSLSLNPKANRYAGVHGVLGLYLWVWAIMLAIRWAGTK